MISRLIGTNPVGERMARLALHGQHALQLPALKTIGWELGKADPDHPGAQRFLATGTGPRSYVGRPDRVLSIGASLTTRVSE